MKHLLSFPDLHSFLSHLRKEGQVQDITVEVDPRLEIAEIHRRVIEQQGPVLLFHNVRGSSFPVVTNLFGTQTRTELAFGSRGFDFIREATQMLKEPLELSMDMLWGKKTLFSQLFSLGTKVVRKAPVLEVEDYPPRLESLPLLTTWEKDGGPFITLPLVYTQHPETRVANLGMYRMQRYSDTATGMHMQIGKGGGFHLARAKELGTPLPVNVFIGGPPAAVLAAIAPLPENVPELLLASLLLGEKIQFTENPRGPLPLLANAEFVLTGSVDAQESHPEGPFGDHYGYYSLQHDFPVFRCQSVFRRKDAIYPATVVGKPKQEDFFIGDHLQELLSPLFPIVMPAVRKLWSYGETGYHSLAAAVVHERYHREALVSVFRILGEGQLALTKFLLVLGTPLDLKDFGQVLPHILERADFLRDFYIFSHTSMDTLDYTGPELNRGSKAALVGLGEPKRSLQRAFHGTCPADVQHVEVFCPGCLVVSGPTFQSDPRAAQRIAEYPAFSDWPLIILSDNAPFAVSSTSNFLWTTFTRFEPASDVYAKRVVLSRFHAGFEPPIVIDCRMKPTYPEELICDEATKDLVDRRWGEYFSDR